ncbi:hypothetical protein EST38_g4790 [Candolleomyces aberdarensis]|uniref:Uncharacterized protein n=1 Tax=Candolleomyces aberdarensis TaxID=2316362 RepID=A0A4Q2DM51_9AGAR|nr:hypothetical protein EST38_g4790 [Candolleomyces aberdarensis]
MPYSDEELQFDPVVQTVVCPLCKETVRVGSGGTSNYAQHENKPKCKDARAKLILRGGQPKPKPKPNASIIGFLKPKATLVTSQASAIPRSHPIQSSFASEPITSQNLSQPYVPTEIQAAEANPALDLVSRLWNLVQRLPSSVPEASEDDALAIFAGDPQALNNATSASEDLWEEVINGMLKHSLGWGTETDIKNIIQRGARGVEGLLNFVEYFVESRGVNEALFEGKLTHLMDEMDKL